MKKLLEIEKDGTKERECRIAVLRNMIQGVKAPRNEKSKPVKDRNLLKRLPQNNGDLDVALYECFMMARRGKTKTVDEYNFEVFWIENLMQLKEDIVKRKWKPSRSKAFITHTPVDREIFAAPFRDRIVHHLLYAVVAPWWDKYFIYDSYSCRRGKGTDFGVERMQKFMRGASQCGKRRAYVLKGDLSGYFMSLNREALYKKVMWGLDRQFPEKGWLYKLCEYLWREVVFDDPAFGARRVGNLKDWKTLPRNKSLFCQPDGQGIVIGNLTSQLLSNIMLNEFDWWMKHDMKFRRYGRYVDDFFVVVEEQDYEFAKDVMMHRAPAKLKEMGLKMHPDKLYIQEVRKGCPFLGKLVKPMVILPGKRYIKNMKIAFRGYVDGTVSYDTVQSYVGMAKHMAAYKLMMRTLDRIE